MDLPKGSEDPSDSNETTPPGAVEDVEDDQETSESESSENDESFEEG